MPTADDHELPDVSVSVHLSFRQRRTEFFGLVVFTHQHNLGANEPTQFPSLVPIMPKQAARAPCLPHSGNPSPPAPARSTSPARPPNPARARSQTPSMSRGRSPSPPSPPPLFLQLPADIVIYLCLRHLPPASAVALSLTCKSLFNLVFGGGAKRDLKINTSERQNLQLLLEKDLGFAWWYCHGCAILHPISTQGPTGVIGDSICRLWLWESARPHHNRRWLNGSSYSIDYQSIRLAMNRHFLGLPNGLPLENFNVKASSVETRPNALWHPWQGKPLPRPLPWQEKWSARILKDELFLSATRTLNGAGWTDSTLRAALDSEWREICGHVRTSGPAFCSITALSRPSSPGVFTPCRGLAGSCRKCLMDYVTTVERRGEEPTASCFITITSYYQLGSGRSPWDAKWEGFGKRMAASAFLMRRDLVAHPLGAVKAMCIWCHKNKERWSNATLK